MQNRTKLDKTEQNGKFFLSRVRTPQTYGPDPLRSGPWFLRSGPQCPEPKTGSLPNSNPGPIRAPNRSIEPPNQTYNMYKHPRTCFLGLIQEITQNMHGFLIIYAYIYIYTAIHIYVYTTPHFQPNQACIYIKTILTTSRTQI